MKTLFRFDSEAIFAAVLLSKFIFIFAVFFFYSRIAGMIKEVNVATSKCNDMLAECLQAIFNTHKCCISQHEYLVMDILKGDAIPAITRLHSGILYSGLETERYIRDAVRDATCELKSVVNKGLVKAAEQHNSINTPTESDSDFDGWMVTTDDDVA